MFSKVKKKKNRSVKVIWRAEDSGGKVFAKPQGQHHTGQHTCGQSSRRRRETKGDTKNAAERLTESPACGQNTVTSSSQNSSKLNFSKKSKEDHNYVHHSQMTRKVGTKAYIIHQARRDSTRLKTKLGTKASFSSKCWRSLREESEQRKAHLYCTTKRNSLQNRG